VVFNHEITKSPNRKSEVPVGEHRIAHMVKLSPAEAARLRRELLPTHETISRSLRRIIRLAFSTFPEGTLLQATTQLQDLPCNFGNAGGPQEEFCAAPGADPAAVAAGPSALKRPPRRSTARRITTESVAAVAVAAPVCNSWFPLSVRHLSRTLFASRL
jgi:hypothetical protein